MAFAFRINSEVLFYREAIKQYELYLKLLESKTIHDLDDDGLDFTHEEQLPSLFIGIKAATLSVILLALSIESALNLCLIRLEKSSNKNLNKHYYSKINIVNEFLTEKIEDDLKEKIICLFKIRNKFVHYKVGVTYTGSSPKILSIFYYYKMESYFHTAKSFFKKISPILDDLYNPISVSAKEVESEELYCEDNWLTFKEKLWYVCKHPYWYVEHRIPEKIKYWKNKHNF